MSLWSLFSGSKNVFLWLFWCPTLIFPYTWVSDGMQNFCNPLPSLISISASSTWLQVGPSCNQGPCLASLLWGHRVPAGFRSGFCNTLCECSSAIIYNNAVVTTLVGFPSWLDSLMALPSVFGWRSVSIGYVADPKGSNCALLCGMVGDLGNYLAN